jgi:hypothetical protein
MGSDKEDFQGIVELRAMRRSIRDRCGDLYRRRGADAPHDELTRGITSKKR